jgi:hypothetical protein
VYANPFAPLIVVQIGNTKLLFALPHPRVMLKTGGQMPYASEKNAPDPHPPVSRVFRAKFVVRNQIALCFYYRKSELVSLQVFQCCAEVTANTSSDLLEKAQQALV